MEKEDVAVESITQVMDYMGKVGSFEDCKKLAATITKNRLRDLFRKRSTVKHGSGRIESLEQQEGLDPENKNESSPDELVADADSARILKGALQQVSEHYRNVVQGVYLEGLTHKEIAERHGLKIGSIGVYLSRGLEALHKILPKDGW